MVSIRPTFAAAAVLLVVGALMMFPAGSAQSGAPANCSTANLNSWWGYQYNQAVRTAWDANSAQSRGVCVMREAGLPIPSECTIVVQAPWWVASGTPASPPLCWWGTPSTPAVTVNAPAGCFATALSARAAYSNAATRALWDYYTAQTVGACESIGQMPGDCRFIVQEQAGKWLCWWPAKGGAGLKQVLDRSAYEKLSSAALGVPEICDLVGKGRSVIEFRIGSERVQIQVKDCKLVDIQWLTPPDGCRDIEPARYAPVVGQAALDAGLANAADVCLLPRAPTQGECASSIAIASSSYLCFYGKKTGGTKAAVAAFTGAAKFFIVGDKGAIRAILNSADATETTRELVCDGNLVMNAEAPADQIKLRLALSDLLQDRICKGSDVNIMNDDRFTVWDGVENRMYLDMGDLGSIGVLNPDGVRVGFLPGTLLGPGSDPFLPPILPNGAENNILSQSPATIVGGISNDGSTQNAVANLGGLGTLAAIMAGQDAATVNDWVFPDEPDAPYSMTDVLRYYYPANLPAQTVGPRGPVPAPVDDGPAETILDDIVECRVICSAATGSEVFSEGSAYLGGAAAGLGARESLQAAGLVVA